MNFESFKQFIESKEGQKSLNEFCEQLEREDKIKNYQLDKFHTLYHNNIDSFNDFVQKVISKYDSDKYKDKCYLKLRIEPPTDLYWFLFDYAEKYGRECTEQEYNKYSNMFTSSIFYINEYYFMRMDGQGSVIEIFK